MIWRVIHKVIIQKLDCRFKMANLQNDCIVLDL